MSVQAGSATMLAVSITAHLRVSKQYPCSSFGGCGADEADDPKHNVA